MQLGRAGGWLGGQGVRWGRGGWQSVDTLYEGCEDFDGFDGWVGGGCLRSALTVFRREGVGPGGEEKVSVFFRGGSEGGGGEGGSGSR